MKYKECGTLPPRTADTMSEAISGSSPDGRISRRGKIVSDARLRSALFGDYQSPILVEEEKENMLRRAAELRSLASRGMCVKKYTKEAERLEALAREIESKA